MVAYATASIPARLSQPQQDQYGAQQTTTYCFSRSNKTTLAPFASLNAQPAFCLAEADSGVQRLSLRQLLNPKHDVRPPKNLVALPVGTRKGTKRRQYVWDGDRIRLVNQDLLEQGYSHADRLQDHMQRMGEGVWNAFFPDPRDVVPSYWSWLPWRLSHRFFSSTMQNFATQSLLAAVGIGASRALAASAAINWMLKDGLGRIARMTVATQFAHTFDSDLKRVRFTTALLFTASMSAEFAAPFAPRYFLALASLANVGKAVGLTTFISTQPAFQQALCTSTNLADISAKTQAQHMVVDTLALGLSATLTWAVRSNPRARMLLPLAVFVVTAAGDLLSIHQELRAVVLRTLNRERAEMVAERWAPGVELPSPAEVSSSEHFLGPPNISGGLLPMRVLPLEQMVDSPEGLRQLLRSYQGRPYLLTYMPASHPLNRPALPWQKPQSFIAAAISDEAGPRELLQLVLETTHLRHSLQTLSELPVPASHTSASRAGKGQEQPSAASTSSRQQDEEAAAHAARTWAAAQIDGFLEGLEAVGWRTNKFLLSTAERCGYQLLEDPP